MKLHVYLLPLSIFILLCQLGPTNAFAIFPMPNSIRFIHPQPVYPSINLDQKETNDDYNHILPFPPFFSIFKRRSFDPFMRSWDREEKEDSLENGTATSAITGMGQEKQNVIVPMSTTDQLKSQVLSTLTPKAKNYSKDTTSLEDTTLKVIGKEVDKDSDVLFRLFPYLHTRFFRPNHFHPRFLHFEKKNNEAQLKENRTQEANFTKSTQNDTTVNVNTDPEMNDAENCIHQRIISHYLFIWKAKWGSLGTHLGIILSLSILFTLGIMYCPCRPEKQCRSISNVKPSLV